MGAHQNLGNMYTYTQGVAAKTGLLPTHSIKAQPRGLNAGAVVRTYQAGAHPRRVSAELKKHTRVGASLPPQMVRRYRKRRVDSKTGNRHATLTASHASASLYSLSQSPNLSMGVKAARQLLQ